MPENFNELTGPQLIALVKLMHAKGDQSLKTLQILLNKNLPSFLFIKLDAKDRMLPFVDWVFQENTLTAQLIPEYKGFYGPKGEFDNLKLGEFHFTELFYKLLINGDDIAINNLIAVLYRKPKRGYNKKRDSEGDIRRPFNSNEVDYYAKIIARWPPHVKNAILMWYDGCRQNLVELYDKVFSTAGEDAADELGMYNIIRNLSGDKFGPIKEVEQIFVHHAFLEIEKIIEENEEAEKQMKQAAK